jgi:Arc/MetJ family transcription regulator
MLTNIDIDDDMMNRCMRITGLRTKKAVVEEALRTILRLHGHREVRDMRGRLRWEDPAAAVAPRPAPAAPATPQAPPAAAPPPAAAAAPAPAAAGPATATPERGGDADPR